LHGDPQFTTQKLTKRAYKIISVQESWKIGEREKWEVEQQVPYGVHFIRTLIRGVLTLLYKFLATYVPQDTSQALQACVRPPFLDGFSVVNYKTSVGLGD
jgi:hypothetical protein